MRTPLLSALRRALSDVIQADRRGVPTDVIREERQRAHEERASARAARIGRRALLGGTVAAAGTLALAGRARATGGGGPDVAIVGAGMAGMACAHYLDKFGIAFKVYEASGRIGGRMYTNDSGYWAQGQITEWGGELIDSGHKTMQKLAELYGLPLDDLLSAQPAGSEEVYHVGGAYYPKQQADIDFRAMWPLVKAELKAADYPTTYDSFTNAGWALDHMSVRAWITSRVPGGLGSPLGKVLDVAYAIEYGADTVDQSALNLLYLLGYQPKPVAFASFGESDEKYHIRGGNQQLPMAIADALPSGTVIKSHKLVKVRRTPAGRTRLTFETGSCTVDKTVDWVVLCLPFAMLADVDLSQADFDALKLQAISQLGRGHNNKLQLQFNQRVWAGPGPWGIANGSTFSDVGYQCSWEPTRGQPGQKGVLNLYGGGSVTDAMQANTAFGTSANATVNADALTGLARIGQVFPGLSWNGKATQSIWHKHTYAKHSYAYYRVGQYTAFGGHEGVRQGGVLFAGDHTSQDFQGFMEGAASEGKRAAKELRDLL